MSELETHLGKSGQQVHIRFAIACPRSGSTLLMRVFSESPQCMVTSRLVLMGNRSKGVGFMPDYSILRQPETHPAYQAAAASKKSFLVCKEELGHESHKGEFLYNILPSLDSCKHVKPAFMIRDPVRTFDSWKHVGWKDVESFLQCYQKLLQMLGASSASYVLLYERLIASPYAELERLCTWWEIPFDSSMLGFSLPFGSFWFQTDREQKIYKENPLGLFSTVRAFDHVVSDIPSHDLVPNHEKEYIESSVGMSYIQLWGKTVNQVRDDMLAKPWFGFDLDDTLHEVRKASGAAVLATLLNIATEYDIPIDKLKASYSRILARKTAQAFTDGKPSDEYRKERFTAVLYEFSIETTDKLLDNLAAIYKASLEIALEPKPGALSLLIYLKSSGKKIMIITEGPQDAQEWTVEKLGIKIDYLATTNSFGVSKVDGLFKLVLDKIEIKPSELVYVGDNAERDVIPARAEGIYAVHYSEKESVSLNTDALKLNTLCKLEHILRGDRHHLL